MGLKLESVVPWGRSLEEYVKMFDLTPADHQLRILDSAGGPASFNIEMTRKGYQVTSCDPVYQFTVSDIAKRIRETYSKVINGVQANLDSYVWQTIQSPEQLGDIRMAAMVQFLEDLPLGIQQERYITAELPVLPFNSNQFDLALCGHFLFTYSDFYSAEFHLASIRELCRVAAEVRIFPLLDISGEASPLLQLVIDELDQQEYRVAVKQVPYEFQKSGNQLMQVFPPV